MTRPYSLVSQLVSTIAHAPPPPPLAAAGGHGNGGSGKYPPKDSDADMMEPGRPRRRLITTKVAARRLNRSHKTLQNWRVKGIGPRWVRLLNRVMYDENEIERFGRVFQSTSQYRPKEGSMRESGGPSVISSSKEQDRTHPFSETPVSGKIAGSDAEVICTDRGGEIDKN